MKLPLWASLFTLLGIAMLCGLGYWQLERLSWKTGLLAAIDAVDSADPMAFALSRNNLARLPPDVDFVRGFASGVYRHELEMRLGPRTHEGRTGYHLITPLAMDGQDVLLVNRGWVPADLDAAVISRPQGPVTVTGTARRPGRDSRFVPLNQPAADKWFRLDISEMAQAKDLESAAPFVLYADKAGANGAYPLAEASSRRPPNNHLSYALFWFTMAGTLALIYVLRFMRYAHKGQEDQGG